MTGAEGTPPVGSLSEEAVRLLDALKSWAGEAGVSQHSGGGLSGDPGASLLADINEHIATGGQDCKYCPICQVIGLVRTTSPEVRHHLGIAASSLLQAASALLAAPTPHSRGEDAGVEHIDLSDDWEED